MNASSPNFASILDEVHDKVEMPKSLPEGIYLALVAGPPRYDKSKKKGTPFVEWPLRITEAIEPPKSMTEEEFEAAVEAAGGLDDKMMNFTIYLTDKNAYRLEQLHEHCGINLAKNKLSRRALNENIVNSEVLVTIEHQVPEGEEDNPEAPRFARIGRTLKAK